MREFWIRIDPQLPRKEKEKLVRRTAKFCTAYVVDPTDENLTRSLGAKMVVSPRNGDVILLNSTDKTSILNADKKRCVWANIRSEKDEKAIAEAIEASVDYIIAKCEDWKIIPLENLIASAYGRSKLLASVSSLQEAEVALETLEIGVDGVLVELSDIDEIERIYEACKRVRSRTVEKEEMERIPLVQAKVTEIKPLRSGARTCIDTCDLMKEGEGMLIGCQSSGFFLIQAETKENPFVNPRPFRVNAGSIAQYLLAQGGNTKYLSELRAGDEVLIVDREGRSRVANVCRTKIEWRPLLLVEAETNNRRFRTIVQNAETIRLVTKDGTKSVKELVKGDEVLVHVQEGGGRHFGRLVKEERVIEQ